MNVLMLLIITKLLAGSLTLAEGKGPAGLHHHMMTSSSYNLAWLQFSRTKSLEMTIHIYTLATVFRPSLPFRSVAPARGDSMSIYFLESNVLEVFMAGYDTIRSAIVDVIRIKPNVFRPTCKFDIFVGRLEQMSHFTTL
jgi:hypothetical protein